VEFEEIKAEARATLAKYATVVPKEEVSDEDDANEDVYEAQLDFVRQTYAVAGDCDACGSEAAFPPKTLMLVLEFPQHYVTLCPEHELVLLSKLLRNYVKRLTKKKNNLGPIPKVLDAEVTKVEVYRATCD
jgi:hypothetical protein